MVLLPCSTKLCNCECPSPPFMNEELAGQSTTIAWIMSFINSLPLSEWIIFGNPKYENTFVTIISGVFFAYFDFWDAKTWHLLKWLTIWKMYLNFPLVFFAYLSGNVLWKSQSKVKRWHGYSKAKENIFSLNASSKFFPGFWLLIFRICFQHKRYKKFENSIEDKLKISETGPNLTLGETEKFIR